MRVTYLLSCCDGGKTKSTPSPRPKTGVRQHTDKCDMNMDLKICNTHGCELSATKVTSTKWEYIKRKKCYGNVSRKVTRWICRGKNSRRTVHTIPTSTKSSDSRLTGGQIRESSGDLHNLLEQNTETG